MAGISAPLAGLPVIDADFSVIIENDDGTHEETPGTEPKMNADGSMEISLPDGSVVIDLNPQFPRSHKPAGFDENLADTLPLYVLGRISGELVPGIQSDDHSRQEWLQARARGIELLGLKLDDPKTGIGSGPLDGMSTVRDPILLEACIRFMSNASAELLPSSGPVKVRNDGAGTELGEAQAEALEKDMNAYLTTTASDYYPDTKRMLFMTGFGGSGFKKAYHSPLKNRPVSESVDAKDLIVSNAAVDLSSAARVTHVIRMKRSDMVRMQILGVYRDVALSFTQPNQNAVDDAMASAQGIQPRQDRPEDQDYTLWECYCELDIEGHQHKDGDGEPTGLPLPYRVTIDANSQEVLEIRRNWDEGDDDFPQARKTFVEYCYIKGWGFYGIGLLHILGNIAVALTAGMREVLDAGMLANFPGFLYLQNGKNKQTTNHFQVPPGGGAALESNGQMSIKDMVMALPYKEPGPAFMSFLDYVRKNGASVGSIAETQVGEGKQNAPVGTTLALIEQQTKVEGAVHKGLHASQAEEFRLLKRLFQEDPASLWRHARRTTAKWNEQLLLSALENTDIVPQADPNTSSHMQRLMKAGALKQVADANPQFDRTKVDLRVLKMIGIDDADSLMIPPAPMAAQPDPFLQIEAMKDQTKRLQIATTSQDKAADRASKEMQEKLKLAKELAIHPTSADVVETALGVQMSPPPSQSPSLIPA